MRVASADLVPRDIARDPGAARRVNERLNTMDSLDFESKCAIGALACWAFTMLCAWGWIGSLIGAIRGLTATLSSEANQNRRQLGELTRPQRRTPLHDVPEDRGILEDIHRATSPKTELIGKVRRQ